MERSTVYELRRLALAALAAHERDQHGGETCDTERVNLLAWLAHCLGLDLADDARLEEFRRRLGDYDAIHREHH
jgi:hypothetical protein